jgi:hypothetical protein
MVTDFLVAKLSKSVLPHQRLRIVAAKLCEIFLDQQAPLRVDAVIKNMRTRSEADDGSIKRVELST